MADAIYQWVRVFTGMGTGLGWARGFDGYQWVDVLMHSDIDCKKKVVLQYMLWPLQGTFTLSTTAYIPLLSAYTQPPTQRRSMFIDHGSV